MPSVTSSANDCSLRLLKRFTGLSGLEAMPVVVDTNFLLALAENDDDALDALRTLRERLAVHRRLVSPTAMLEAGFLSRQQADKQLAALAGIAVDKCIHEWRFE